jgi:hypothetical protein
MEKVTSMAGNIVDTTPYKHIHIFTHTHTTDCDPEIYQASKK